MARPVASASTYGGRDAAWNAGPVSPAARKRAVSASRIVRFSQWTSSMPPRARRGAQQREQHGVVDAEVVDHERLEGRHAAVDEVRDLGDRVLVGRRDDRAQADVHGRVAGGRRDPLAEAGAERPSGGRRRPGARVVEREERRRATEGRGHRVLEEPVGLLVAGDSGVRVDVDDARQHQQPGRVDDRSRRGREPAQPRLDRRDPPGFDRDVDRCRPGRVDDHAAEDQQVRGHGALSRARRSRSPARHPTGSAGPPRAAGRPSRPRAAPSRSDSPRAGPPWTRSCTRRTGRRSRTR